MLSNQTELDLKAENERLRKLIRCEATEPPYDVADDMTTEFAVQLAAANVKIAELDAEIEKLLRGNLEEVRAIVRRDFEEIKTHPKYRDKSPAEIADLLEEAGIVTATACNWVLAMAAKHLRELEKSATTLRQLEELLRDGWTVVYRIVRDAPVFFVYHQNHLVNPDEFCESTIPAAIAAAFAAKGE